MLTKYNESNMITSTMSQKSLLKKRKLDEEENIYLNEFDKMILDSIMNSFITRYYSTISDVRRVLVTDSIGLRTSKKMVETIKIAKSAITTIHENYLVNDINRQYGINVYEGTPNDFFIKKCDCVYDVIYLDIICTNTRNNTMLLNMFKNGYIGVGTILILTFKISETHDKEKIVARIDKQVKSKKLKIQNHVRITYDDKQYIYSELFYICNT
jgi:hypothetical protein